LPLARCPSRHSRAWSRSTCKESPSTDSVRAHPNSLTVHGGRGVQRGECEGAAFWRLVSPVCAKADLDVGGHHRCGQMEQALFGLCCIADAQVFRSHCLGKASGFSGHETQVTQVLLSKDQLLLSCRDSMLAFPAAARLVPAPVLPASPQVISPRHQQKPLPWYSNKPPRAPLNVGHIHHYKHTHSPRLPSTSSTP